jgi:hypothetical protein
MLTKCPTRHPIRSLQQLLIHPGLIYCEHRSWGDCFAGVMRARYSRYRLCLSVWQ